jgi:hypothetical protein
VYTDVSEKYAINSVDPEDGGSLHPVIHGITTQNTHDLNIPRRVNPFVLPSISALIGVLSLR